MAREGSGVSGTSHCNLCGHTIGVEALAEHLLAVHGIDLDRELLRWPDGSPVIVDETLEPEDFTG